MGSLEKNGGSGCVCETAEHASIIGTAFIKTPQSTVQNHIAVLDFFVLDGFLDRAEGFVRETITQSGLSGSCTILCYCPGGDTHKKQVLLSLGAELYAALPGFVRINDKLRDVIIYKLTRKS